MAGTFEIIREGKGTFLFRLTAADGTVVALSPRFTTIEGVVDGIEAVRENAAAGYVVDQTSGTTDPRTGVFLPYGRPVDKRVMVPI